MLCTQQPLPEQCYLVVCPQGEEPGYLLTREGNVRKAEDQQGPCGMFRVVFCADGVWVPSLNRMELWNVVYDRQCGGCRVWVQDETVAKSMVALFKTAFEAGRVQGIEIGKTEAAAALRSESDPGMAM